MIINTRLLFGVFIIATGALFVFSVNNIVYSFSSDARLEHCVGIEQENRQIDCVYRVIDRTISEKGIEEGFKIFAAAYDMFPSFSGTGCHKHAHRVGDMVYYGIYLSENKNIEDIYFPQESSSCGYGFFHGFIEHLIQDNPDPKFVTNVCDELSNALGGRMGAIEITCYHGSGHGFTLHQSENVSKERWGDLTAFTDGPIRECESLPKANSVEIEECRQGVFNVIVDWMSDKEYGFAYTMEDPFAACNDLGVRLHSACYYEMAQKLDFVSGNDPKKMRNVIIKIPDDNLRETAFKVGIAGVIQQTIVGEEWRVKVLVPCLDLGSPFSKYCVESVVNGLFEHGPPTKEYEQVLELCSEKILEEGGVHEACYGAFSKRLSRFYDEDKTRKICNKIPEKYQEHCSKWGWNQQ
jgi:hypothetical protein